jgi:hypothetical protein
MPRAKARPKRAAAATPGADPMDELLRRLIALAEVEGEPEAAEWFRCLMNDEAAFRSAA